MLWRGGALRAYGRLGATLALVLLAGCATTQPFVQLTAERDAVAADGRGAPAPLSYSLARPAAIDLYAVGTGGERFYLRRSESRPAGQDYQYLFDGTYPLPESPGERRVLPDGSYTLVLEAQAASGQRQAIETQVAVRNADTSPPSVTDLAVYPPAISPNFDGQDDAAAITYRLGERARVSVFAADAQGRRVYVGPQVPREPGEYREQWDGLDNKQAPLPDGEYQFTITASDAAGNVSVARTPIRLGSGGRPEARLISVSFFPRQLASGGTLTVQMRVRNTGATVLRTQGPEPGFLYSSYDTYASVLDRQFVDRAGVWRVGVDWAGSPSGAVSKYPYRWGFGRDLAPGEETTVEGRIQLEHGPLQDRQVGPPNNRVYFYAGLIQENMAFFDDQVGGTWIELGY
jgi:hypothetical protein